MGYSFAGSNLLAKLPIYLIPIHKYKEKERWHPTLYNGKKGPKGSNTLLEKKTAWEVHKGIYPET